MSTIYQVIADGHAPEEAVSLWREMPGEVKARGQLPLKGRYPLFASFVIMQGILRHRPRLVLTWGAAASASCPWLRPQWQDHPWLHVAYSPDYGPIRAYRHADHLIVPTLDIAAWFVKGGFDVMNLHVIPRLPLPEPAIEPAAEPLVIRDEEDVSGDHVISAWQVGRPVVAVSAVGPAALIASEADGLLTPLGDPESLAAATLRVRQDPSLARRLVQGGKARFDSDFSEEAVMRRWRETLRKLAS
jgi:glycosyltransferase involved in cell wall biosynthesis